MRRAGRWARTATLALLVVAAGCSRVESQPRAQVAPAPPPAPVSTVATVPAPPPPPPKSTVASARVPKVEVFTDATGATAAKSLAHPNDYGEPLVFLVKQAQGELLEVFLPSRPNGATGWVRSSDVTLSENEWRMEVELEAHRLTVWKGAEVVREETVAIGKDGAPTPTGDFYVTELLDTGNPRGPYGPWAFGLSAYSDVYTSFAGGPGQVGLHGTNDPSSLGQSVSHGCVRVTNDAITALADELPVGTPISIT